VDLERARGMTTSAWKNILHCGDNLDIMRAPEMNYTFFNIGIGSIAVGQKKVQLNVPLSLCY